MIDLPKDSIEASNNHKCLDCGCDIPPGHALCEEHAAIRAGFESATHAYLGIKKDSPKCQCNTCLLSRRIQKHFPDMTPDQRAVINELWNRMECAELDLNVIEAKKDGSWPNGDDE